MLARHRESTGLESQPEHFITLPLVSKNEDSADLPLVMNVVIKYWGEDISPPTSGVASDRGATMIHGIELAETLGFSSYIYKGSMKDLKKRIDQGIPPIVIMPGIQATVQHAMVVSGYDTTRSEGSLPMSQNLIHWVQFQSQSLSRIGNKMT